MTEEHHGPKHCDPAEEARRMIETLDKMYYEKPVGFMAFMVLNLSRRHRMPFGPPPFGPAGGPPFGPQHMGPPGGKPEA